MNLPRTIAVITDTHCGRESLPAVVCGLAVLREVKPDLVIHLGDAEDFEGLMRARVGRVGPRTADDAALAVEEERLISGHFWRSLRESAGKAPIYCLRSNHGARYYRRLIEALPHLSGSTVSYPEYVGMAAAGVHYLDAEYLEIGGWYCTHGDRYGETGPRWTMLKDYGSSVIQGHCHRLEATPWRRKNGRVDWYCSAGCWAQLADWADVERQHHHGLVLLQQSGPVYVPRLIPIFDGRAALDAGQVTAGEAEVEQYWRPIRATLAAHAAAIYQHHYRNAHETSGERNDRRQWRPDNAQR